MKIDNYRKAYNELIDEFMRIYFDDEGCDEEDKAYCESGYLNDSNRPPYHHPIEISDEYWDIRDIYMALSLKMPRHIVTSWYSDYLDETMEGKTFLNLYTYYKLNYKVK